MSDKISEIKIARWGDRFLSWLIDFVTVSVVFHMIIYATVGDLRLVLENEFIWTDIVNYVPASLVFFAYWSVLEYKTGQSLGKKILRLKVINMDGDLPNLKGVLISSFGKAFLLPFDMIIGWIFTNKNRQRMFNKIGDTLVVKISADTDKYGKYDSD